MITPLIGGIGILLLLLFALCRILGSGAVQWYWRTLRLVGFFFLRLPFHFFRWLGNLGLRLFH